MFQRNPTFDMLAVVHGLDTIQGRSSCCPQDFLFFPLFRIVLHSGRWSGRTRAGGTPPARGVIPRFRKRKLVSLLEAALALLLFGMCVYSKESGFWFESWAMNSVRFLRAVCSAELSLPGEIQEHVRNVDESIRRAHNNAHS